MALEVEQEEVRSLLSRHKSRIEIELQQSNLLDVLVRKSVITSSEENLLKASSTSSTSSSLKLSENENCINNTTAATTTTAATATTKVNDIDDDCCSDAVDINLKKDTTATTKTSTLKAAITTNNDSYSSKEQCIKLIDLIAENGFEKFKNFCFAIENECPQLIDDLINDRFKKDEAEEKENQIDDNTGINNEKEKTDIEEPTTDSSININYLEYVNSNLSSTPYSSESYGDGITISSATATTTNSSSTISPKFQHSPVNYNQILQNVQNSSTTTTETISTNNNSNITNSNTNTNNYSSSLRKKLFHRFSDAATMGRRLKKKKNSDRSCYSMSDTIEIFADPVVEDDGERSSWEYHTVIVTRVPGYGFGIAVSGGRDNPHFANGDPSIAVSDVLKGGPAEDRLQVNDRIVSVNGVSLENVEYATAVQVLRDSGNTVTLVVKRRVTNPIPIPPHQHPQITNNTVGGTVGMINNPTASMVPVIGLQSSCNQGQPIRVTLTKSSKKDDFGIVLGCRLFIKEISAKTRDQLIANGYSLNEGDIITRVHNTNCNDSMSLKEAKKIIDGCKERLNLVVLRDITNQNLITTNNLNNLSNVQSTGYSHTQPPLACNNNLDDPYVSGVRYSSQNLYVQPPTRGGSISTPNDEKSNLTPRGRSRVPLMDVSLSQLDRPSTPLNDGSLRRSDEPPRPPPPRGEDYYSCRRQLYEDDPLQRSRQSAEPRFISFQKEGSVGIRLTGGNEAGIFVTAVQPGSPASLQGLTPGDKILKVNDMDMHGVTREEAVLFLLSLQDRIDLIVQYCKDEYEEVVANQRGDSFHIKTHFHCDNPSKGEMAFKAGDVFRVIDTLHNGVVGSWQVLKIGRGHQEMQRGVIPNKSRAEELATAQFNATKKELNTSESRGNFFKRRRTHRRSKSLSKENWDDVVFSDSISKFPAYERVVLRHPGFVRPVVLFGPVSDIAREKLTKDFPDKFTVPLQDDDKSGTKSRIVRLSNIRDIMDRGKHALLDITPNAVDRLNYAQFYPIVIFLKADTKHIIKQLRQNLPKSVHKSSKKLFEQCQKLEKVWSHIFSTTIMLHDTESWYRKLREAIDLQQSGAVWMSESKPVESLSDDFLFPMSTTSRLSYASSPESDLELSPGPSASLSLGNLPQLVKSSSDPSIATNQDNADRDRDIVGDGLPPPYTHHFDHPNSAHSRLQASLMENKYSFPTNTAVINQNHSTSGTIQDVTANSVHRIPSIYGMNPPDLPPRIDRASKPLIPPSTAVTNSTLANNQLSNIQSGQLNSNNRSAQDNIYGSSSGGGGVSGSGTGSGIGGGGGVVKHLNSVIGDDLQNDYHSRHTDSIERTQNSLEHQRIVGQIQGTPNKSTGSVAIPQSATSSISAPTATTAINPQQQNGYDSVSSYESYNTTQLSVQNIRLGPNAPDDLKSVPTASARHLSSSATVSNTCDYRSPHDHNLRGFSGINDLNVQNSPGRPSIHDINSGRNIDTRNSSNLQQGLNVSQRPTNLNLDNSPRKHVLETKTDYGKYSRSNSASQADYSKSMKSHSIHSQSHNLGVINGTGSGNNSGSNNNNNNNNNMNNSNSNSNNNNNNSSNSSNIPFKPVPPPKPKNYRAPIQGQINAGHWENGEQSPRSPNGFFYPPTPAAHYHHSQTNSGSSLHNTNSIINNGPQNLNYSHCSPGHISHPPPPPPSNGYKNNQHYNSPYAHRGHPSLSNLPIHSPERQALDLAGSREQRGSAFELYRKPQVGNVGHHHNVRDMESNDHRRYYRQYLQNSPQHHQHQQQQQQQQYQNHQNHQYQHQQHQEHMMTERIGGMMHCQQLNEMNDFNYRYYKKYYETPPPPPLPPPLPMKKEKKKSVLKNPFTAFKNAILKTTRPLRRMSSMVEPEKKLKPCLRRQYSLMEHRSSGRAYPCPLPPPPTSSLPLPNDKYSSHFPPSSPSSEQSSSNFNLNPNSDSFYPPDDMNSTYRSLKSVDIYKSSRIDFPHRTQQDFDDLYANRALIDLERRQAESKSGGRRIIRRHSMAERSTANSHHHSRYHHDHQQGMSPYDHDGDVIDMCRNYPDSLSLNEKRAPGSEIMMRRRFNSSNNEPIYKSRMEMHRNHLYQSRKEMQERIAQGKREMEREFSNSKLTSGNGAMLDEDHHQIYKSKAEMQENNFRIKSPTQLKEHIYQSRRDAMESMAEPTNISRRAMMTHEPIYETREECVISSKENVTDEKKEEKHEISADGTLTSDSKQSECSNETVIENQKITTENNCCNETNLDPDTSITTTAATMAMAATTEVYKTPFHISNILKRTAPLPSPDTNASSTSIETHYTSQNSLPVEPPNATSTPYQSDTYLPNSNTASTTTTTAAAEVESLIRTTTTTPPRESSTTKGIFDETGGTLIDNIWNVSLHIPPGAIPSGVKQEIYFTVSDPRISQMVRGPPLDMENGETMLSPLVMCGPQGLEFLIPVTLNIPHCAGKTTSLGLSLKATDSEKSLHTNWDNIELPSNTAAHTVSVKVDHF